MDSLSDRQRRIVEDARREIDRLDLEIVTLFNARALQVRRIGDVKRELGLPIYQPDREEEIFSRVVAANPGPLANAAIRRLFERILDEARRHERTQ